MEEHSVVIVGAGPAGLMLAAELALAGVDLAILERRESQAVSGSRSGGLHARTIEVFDQRGIADRFLSEGQVAQVAGFAGIRLDISDFPTRHPYGLALRQSHIEPLLAGWVGELGVRIRYGVDVTGFTQDDGGVDVEVAGGQSVRSSYLIGCDGGRSLVRKTAGIDFPGSEPTTSNLIAEVELTEEPPEWGIRRDEIGIHALSRLDDGRVGVMVTEREVRTTEPTLADLSARLIDVYGTDFGAHSVRSLSWFTDATRQAATYRAGRVLLAGDAAHIHPPDGGQGLQLGVQDAVNLGWKLAQVVRGWSPDALLDSYGAERHPVAARALRTTMASIVLRPDDERTTALREIMSELLAMDEPRRRLAGMLSGLDIHYDLGEGLPLLGRRMPDLDLVTADGSVRAFSLLHEARPVLVVFGGAVDVRPWADHVRRVDARYAGSWDLPVIGNVPAPTAVLIRPDGYVAWVGEGTDAGLADALATWCGAPAVQARGR